MSSVHDMQWQRLDLNLLRVFAAIWEHRHLGRAAGHLHITPSAVSHALRRLREQLGDPLFVREGRRLRPTARAERLAPALQNQLRQLRSLLMPDADFDPARSQRAFVLGVREALEPLVLPELFTRIRQQASSISLASVRLSRSGLAAALREGRLDLGIDVELEWAADIQRSPLLREPLCVVMRNGHALSRGLGLEDYLRAEHVLVSGRPAGPAMEDAALAAQGQPARRVALRCQNYQAGVSLVAGTDLLLTMPRRFARRLGEPLALHARSLPFATPPLALYAYWHASAAADAGSQWLRSQVSALKSG